MYQEKIKFELRVFLIGQVDSRILRAVAIEHCKDGDTAVEVVLNEVIPCLTKLPSTSAEHSGVTGISSAGEA